jgi:hypothetical protein
VYELCQWVYAAHAMEVSTTTMPQTSCRFGVALKRSVYMPPSNGVRTSRDPAKTGFLDKMWATTSMAWMRGCLLRVQRYWGLAPAGHWRIITFVYALNTWRQRTLLILDGPNNGATFRA